MFPPIPPPDGGKGGGKKYFAILADSGDFVL